jgi:hypothetical protein
VIYRSKLIFQFTPDKAATCDFEGTDGRSAISHES